MTNTSGFCMNERLYYRDAQYYFSSTSSNTLPLPIAVIFFISAVQVHNIETNALRLACLMFSWTVYSTVEFVNHSYRLFSPFQYANKPVLYCISSCILSHLLCTTFSYNVLIYPEKVVIWFHKEVRHNKVIILALKKALAATTHFPPLPCTDVPAVTIASFLVHRTVLLDRGEHQ